MWVSVVRTFVCVCVVTLHSCPILAMVALPVCSPSMAFSLKNRKILSSSGLSLSGIKFTPMNLGSRGGKSTDTHCSLHAWVALTNLLYCIMYFTIRPLPSMANPLAPILHLRNQSPVIFSSHGSVITAIHFTPCCHSIWLYPKWALQVQIPHNPCLWTTSSQNTHGSDCPG